MALMEASSDLAVRGLLAVIASAVVAYWWWWMQTLSSSDKPGEAAALKPDSPHRTTNFAIEETWQRTAIRAAIDIGSGNHKLCIAEVDLDVNTILRVIHTEQKQVMLKHALLQSSDGCFTEAVMATSYSVLVGFRTRAIAAGATQFAGVATAVFRRAANGEAFLERVNNVLKLRVRVASQRLEGELGHLSASSSLPRSPSCKGLLCDAEGNAPLAPLVAWDSGGGSFQASATLLSYPSHPIPPPVTHHTSHPIPRHTTPHRTAPHRTAPHHTPPHQTTAHHPPPHHTTPPTPRHATPHHTTYTPYATAHCSYCCR